MNGISVVIPVYKAELTLRELYNQLVPVMEALTERFEVVMVEDCGGDGSWAIIQEFVGKDERIRGIRLSRNYGQHNALLCGVRAARYDVIVTMDDDLQNPVSEIQLLLNKLAEGFDVVYGAPQRQQHGLWRNMASRLTKLALQGAMGIETARNVSAFRAFRTKLRHGFSNYRSPSVSIDALLTWSTSNFTAITTRHDPRVAGESNYTLGKLITHGFNLMTGFSALPLRLASITGFVFAFFGVVVLAWVLIRYFISGSSVPGFPFLASILAIFSGAQLLALGIFGEYLARMHFRSMDRPPYVVGETCGKTISDPQQSAAGP
jgi:undecaprenyl-phosphate 4-deoxy-4-formamido-L-arabinose transferase